MSLQFILGGAGSGKSAYLYENICKEAALNPSKRFFVLVPEQFTLETQKTLVMQSKGHGIMNIDVLSFNRLAYRVFEEFPALAKTILEDMGKTMVLQKVLSKEKKHLIYFGKGLTKPGFLDELKSFLCELLIYRIDEDGIDKMIAAADTDSLMEYKLKDLKRIYRAFREKLEGEYMTAEEILPQLSDVVEKVDMLRDSVIAIDGFTGFTPVQYELLTKLLKVSERLYITLDADIRGKRDKLFRLTADTIRTLEKICNEQRITVDEPILSGKGKEGVSYRFREESALSFLERNLFCYATPTYEKEQEEISVTVLKNPREEAKWVARQVWWLVAKEGYRYQDIAVVTGDLPGYQEYLQAEFETLNIRYFIDYKKSIGGNALSEYVLSFIEMIRKDMDYESTMRFLRCGLLPFEMEEIDLLENVILAFGRRGFYAYDKEWKAPYRQEEKYDMNEINRLRQALVDMIRASREKLLGGKKTVGDYVRALYEFLVSQNIYAKLKERVAFFEEKQETLLAKEYKNVYQVMMNLFEQMDELLGDEPISLSGFKELLGAGISEGLVGFTPPAMDQVVVGDVERTRLKDVKIMFFVGMNDGIIPKGGTAPGILSEREREVLKEQNIALAPSGRELIFTEQFYMYLNLTKPSEKLFLSYCQTGQDGSGLRPSYLLGRIYKLFPSLCEISEEDSDSYEKLLGTDKGFKSLLLGLSDFDNKMSDKRFAQLFAHYMKQSPEALQKEILSGILNEKKDTRLSKEAVELLYGDELQGSVTRLENFAKCPFSHFLSYGLCLKERDEYHIGSMDFGNMFHQSLENFSAMLHKEKRKWRDIQEEEIHDMVEECVDKAAMNYKDSLFEQSMRSKYVLHRIRRIMSRTIETMAEQMRRGDFEQAAYEISFQALDHLEATHLKLEHDKHMKLNGRIDRIDTIETEDNTFVRVIDYKTGNTEFELNSFYYGLQMQLVVYLETAAAMEGRMTGKNGVPAGMYYYHVKDPMLDVYEEDDEARKELFLKELALDGFTLADGRANTIPTDAPEKKKKLLTEKDMQNLIRHTRKKMTEFGNEIINGNKDIKPYQMGTSTACDYCRFKSICRFDVKEQGDEYRQLVKKEEKEIWEDINE